jgi:hypothetical protein
VFVSVRFFSAGEATVDDCPEGSSAFYEHVPIVYTWVNGSDPAYQVHALQHSAVSCCYCTVARYATACNAAWQAGEQVLCRACLLTPV